MRKKFIVTLFIVSLLFAVTTETAVGLPSNFLTPFEEASTQPQIFTPVDDTFVNESNPNRNFGSRSRINTDSSPVQNIYLKFDVQGVGIAPSATLKFYTRSNNPLGLNIHTVSDTSWDEDTMLWTNTPPIGPVVATTGPLQGGNWYSIDVSDAVSGDGIVSLAITNLSASLSIISSKESNKPPELQILTDSSDSPDPFVVRRDGNTYYAESQTTTSSYSGSLKSVVESAANELNAFGGGTVTFLAGDFDLGAEWLELYNLTGITFEGQGIDVTTLRNDTDAATDTEPFDFTRSDRITIRDMTISASGPPRSTSDAIDFDAGDENVVERVKITSSRGRGIIFDGKDVSAGQPQTANRNHVSDCVITGVPGDGIELLASSYNLIENCLIFDVGGHGIQINKSSSVAAQPNKKSNNNAISGNHIDNAGSDGINLISGDHNVLSDNTILNSSDDKTSQDGIQITSGSSIPCDDNVVYFNTATDNQAVKTQRYGLSISSSNCNGTVVADNNFSGNRVGDIQDKGTDTNYISFDFEPPTVPTGLVATNVTYSTVDLAWEPSTDNVGVTSYTVYRDGTPIDSVDGATTTYQDNAVAHETSYTYTVEAFDAAGNGSGQSAPLQVTTPSAPTTFTFVAAADAYVDANSPTRNRGSLSILRVDSTPELNTYLRFEVQGVVGTVSQATLRVYANSSSPVGYDIRSVGDNSWDEATINYTNAPAFGPVEASSGPFSGQLWTEVDVTLLINGDGAYSLAMTTPHTTAISCGSRESANPPELIIDVGP